MPSPDTQEALCVSINHELKNHVVDALFSADYRTE